MVIDIITLKETYSSDDLRCNSVDEYIKYLFFYVNTLIYLIKIRNIMDSVKFTESVTESVKY